MTLSTVQSSFLVGWRLGSIRSSGLAAVGCLLIDGWSFHDDIQCSFYYQCIVHLLNSHDKFWTALNPKKGRRPTLEARLIFLSGQNRIFCPRNYLVEFLPSACYNVVIFSLLARLSTQQRQPHITITTSRGCPPWLCWAGWFVSLAVTDNLKIHETASTVFWLELIDLLCYSSELTRSVI